MSATFLETVLPQQGAYYCAVSIKNGTVKQQFVKSKGELEEVVGTINQSQADAYFATAAFNTTTRKAENAELLRSVYVDLDVGEGKPYKDQRDALVALREFTKTHGIPKPLIVNSGNGIHAYWPFTSDITRAEWLPVAKALKALCIKSELGIDPTVTADAARILRIPGTNNHKQPDNPREVTLLTSGAGPMEFDRFRLMLPVPEVALDLSAARAFGVDEVTRNLGSGEYPESNFAKIVELPGARGCAQIQHAVENSHLLTEPLWRAAMSIAWNCNDAETAIHMVSDKHADYTPEATLDKAQRLTGKPHTCQWYRNNNPSLCKGCKHNVVSPITLGRIIRISEAEDGKYTVTVPMLEDGAENNTAVTIDIPEYPFPYVRMASGGVAKQETDKDGIVQQRPLYPYDFYISERFYDSGEHGDGAGELGRIRVHLPHDGVREFDVPVSQLLSTDSLRDLLVSQGVFVYGNDLKECMAYIATALRRLQANSLASRTRNQMGWTPEDNFVVGNLEYAMGVPRLAPAASGTRQLAPAFQAKGSLDVWKDIVAFYNRPGLELHAFAFLVGAGAPMLQLLNNSQVRGAMLNLVSNASGTGKTTVQMMINSIFGHPTQLLMTKDDTVNAKFHRMGTLNSIALCIDEMTNETPENISALVYGATNGRAKHRMESQSNKLRANQTSWCTIVVCSSNAVMADALLAHKSAAEGELRRVIDLHIPTPKGIPKEESDAVFNRMADNYGVAGGLYAKYLSENKPRLSRRLLELQKYADSSLGLERSDRFYSAMFAVAMAAGEVFTELGLLKWDLPRIFNMAKEEFTSVGKANRVAVQSGVAMGEETLARFINENFNNILVINGIPPADGLPRVPLAEPRGALKARYEPDTGDFVVGVNELRDFFTSRRVDISSSLKAFKDSGVLRVGSGGSSSQMRRLAAGAVGGMNTPNSRCYVFDASKLQLSGEPETEEGADGTAA